MKSVTVLLIILFSLCISAQDTLTILHVNDTHSMLAPLSPRNEDLSGTRGGIARAASIIGLTKMTEKNVLTLHGGDVFMGDVFFNTYFGVAEFKIMNMLGFDAMALGNHEFDLTPSTLLTAFDSSLAQGGFEVLSANTILEDPEVQSLKKYIKPYTIKSFGSIKVGIFGMTTSTTNYYSLPSPAAIDEKLVEVTGQMVVKLISEGCNLIIMLSHLGIQDDAAIASGVPGIDIIIGAHDHKKTDEPVEMTNPAGKTTYIVQTDGLYTQLGQMKIVYDNGITSFSDDIIELDGSVPEEPIIKAAVDNLIQEIETTFGIPFYTQQVGFSAETFNEVSDPFTTRGNHSTAVGNLVADAFRSYTNTDVAVIVGGSTSQPLYKGPIVPADIFRMIGYGFNEINGLGYRITKFKLTGAELWAVIQACLALTVSDDELLPQVSGMEYSFIQQGEVFVLDWIKINKEQIDPTKIYSITSNEFLSYAMGNLFEIPIKELEVDSLITEFQVLLSYIIEKATISPSDEARVTPVLENRGIDIPKTFDLKQNYPNPFNPETTIEFSLPEKSEVTLKIYNILGSEAVTLVNEQLIAGTYKYNWNATGFASGIYFYKISAGKYIFTKKLILLK